MNPLTANPVTVLQESRAKRSREPRAHRDRAVHAARSARQALEQVAR